MRTCRAPDSLIVFTVSVASAAQALLPAQARSTGQIRYAIFFTDDVIGQAPPVTPFYSSRGRSPVRIQAAELQGAGAECGQSVPRGGLANVRPSLATALKNRPAIDQYCRWIGAGDGNRTHTGDAWVDGIPTLRPISCPTRRATPLLM